MALAPGRADLHARAREAAKDTGALVRYVEAATDRARSPAPPQGRRRAWPSWPWSWAILRRQRSWTSSGRASSTAWPIDLSDEPPIRCSRCRACARRAGRHRGADARARRAGRAGRRRRAQPAAAPTRSTGWPRSRSESPRAWSAARSSCSSARLRIEMRHAQAADILRQAALSRPRDSRQVLDIYERVARTCGRSRPCCSTTSSAASRRAASTTSRSRRRSSWPCCVGAAGARRGALARRGGGGAAQPRWRGRRGVGRAEAGRARAWRRGELAEARPAPRGGRRGAGGAGHRARPQAGRARRRVDRHRARGARSTSSCASASRRARAVWQPLFELYPRARRSRPPERAGQRDAAEAGRDRRAQRAAPRSTRAP